VATIIPVPVLPAIAMNLQAEIATDRQGVVVSWNATAAQIYGWSTTEAIGRPLTELISPSSEDITDITERRARRALEASQRGLAESQRIAHLGSFELDAVAGQMTWSDELYRVLGIDPSVEATA
jgi:PAS domain S-box-containing protein